jgi:serine/threonine-protein kinase HipA
VRLLDVYLHRQHVGTLVQNEGGQMVFEYLDSWLENTRTVPLSHSLPLQSGLFLQKQCRGFFGGILPEEDSRKIIARILGISENNDFAMLEQIGGECAGAVSFLPSGTPFPYPDDEYRNLSLEQLAELLRELPRRPLMAGSDGIRLSLAGAQDKVSVRVEDGNISLPLNSAPSTHILKPEIVTYEGIVSNESFCLALADIAGLTVAKATVGEVENLEYLLVERFDREITGNGAIQRLHQEDFCQALGYPSQNKYQGEGGPSLKDCFALLREVSTSPVIDLMALLDAVIFNFVIGNNDAHGKNYSLLYYADASVRFAPLYDLVCTVYYPELTDNMAMKIGNEKKSSRISPRHFEKLAEDTGLAGALVKRRVLQLAVTIEESLENITKPTEASVEVAEIIRQRCEEIVRRF